MNLSWINSPVQNSLWRSLHDQKVTRGIVLHFMDRELREGRSVLRTRHVRMILRNIHSFSGLVLGGNKSRSREHVVSRVYSLCCRSIH